MPAGYVPPSILGPKALGDGDRINAVGGAKADAQQGVSQIEEPHGIARIMTREARMLNIVHQIYVNL